MKVTDLMLNDLVLYRGEVARVISISLNGEVSLLVDGHIVARFVCADELSPIPITPEILEKNGFKNDFYEEESVADYHTIRLEGYSLKHKIGKIDGYLVTWCNGGVNVTTDLHGCVQKDISYVHELQHALKLCKIDKEITL